MDLEHYNRSYEEFIETFDEEAEYRLRAIRQQCIRDFIGRICERQQEWDSTFRDLLQKSQELSQSREPQAESTSALQQILSKPILPTSPEKVSQQVAVAPANNSSFELLQPNSLKQNDKSENKTQDTETRAPKTVTDKQQKPRETQQAALGQTSNQLSAEKTNALEESSEFNDPQFSNVDLVKEFIRMQEVLENAQKSYSEISSNQSMKSFKNELNLFIRTQINSISNSDSQHLDSKVRMLTSLFSGHKVSFQDRLVDASIYAHGQLFAMDLAAQTFVTVGTRLVNSVPAIAKSMSSVMNGVIDRNFMIFKDLVIGHLQQRCPYLIPMYPKRSDFSRQNNPDVNYKIACGYSFDPKTQSLEQEEKYLIRMRSMALIYACFLIQGHLNLAWSWLAAFLSLKPKPVITATILQAFLQEASKKMSTKYGRQYKKLITFIRSVYVKMIEEVTVAGVERQSLIKLQNLLQEDSNLFATPSMGSIFGAARLS